MAPRRLCTRAQTHPGLAATMPTSNPGQPHQLLLWGNEAPVHHAGGVVVISFPIVQEASLGWQPALGWTQALPFTAGCLTWLLIIFLSGRSGVQHSDSFLACWPAVISHLRANPTSALICLLQSSTGLQTFLHVLALRVMPLCSTKQMDITSNLQEMLGHHAVRWTQVAQ
jgi:hypothetical protein